MGDKPISVEVAYALPHKQRLISLEVPVGTTAYEAALISRIAECFPEIELDSAKIGIFGKVLSNPRAHCLRCGDRVEIYRPLLIDPREARRMRAKKAR